MEYIWRVHTVVEMPSYLRAAEAIFTETERSEIVSRLAADPECGDLIQGTGGFRKSGSDAVEWEDAAALASYTFSATPVFQSSSSLPIRRTRKRT